MSLKNLLNNDDDVDEKINVQQKMNNDGDTVLRETNNNNNGNNNNNNKDINRMEIFEKKMDIIKQVDMNEHLLQDWNFASLQELELITVWNSQIKELLDTSSDGDANGEPLNHLINNMDNVNKEWMNYEEYLNKKDKTINKYVTKIYQKIQQDPQTNSNNIKNNMKNKEEKEEEEEGEGEEDEEEEEVEEVEVEGEEDAENNDRKDIAEKDHLANDASNGSNEAGSAITKTTTDKLIPTTQYNGKDLLIQPKKRKYSKRRSKKTIVQDIENVDIEDSSTNNSRNKESDGVAEQNGKDHTDAGDDDANSDVDMKEEDEAEDGEESFMDVDTNDDKDAEYNEYGNNTHRKKLVIKNIQTEEEKTRNSILKMVNKNKKKQGEERKRRFTQCTVSDFNEKKNILEISITLKQHHVKIYKRHQREREQLKKKEEKAIEAEKASKIAALSKKQAQQQQQQQEQKGSASSTSLSNKKLLKNGNGGSNMADDLEDLEDQDDELGTDAANTNKVIPALDTTNNHFETENLPKYGLKMTAREARAVQRHYDNTLFAIWKDLARKDSHKYSRLLQQMQHVRQQNYRKIASLVAREARKWQSRNLKQVRDIQVKARRGIREMLQYWKKNEKDGKELKKKRDKELLELTKKEEEEKEKMRQAKQLEFLLTKSEMVSHFIAKKVKTSQHEAAHNSTTDLNAANDADDDRPNIELDLSGDIKEPTQLHEIDFENENKESLDQRAIEHAANVLKKQQRSVQTYDFNEDAQDELNFQNPSTLGDSTLEQPKMLACSLKEYQLNGLRWLNSIYSMGMNGILADEMGLGKTVQSISMLTNLAENHNIWGPFLVVTPASTLHNWVQEISKFVPDFKILPYWGNGADRKILRRFWDRKHLRYDKDSPFHIMITSYQMVVSDAAYLQKMKWQYMILDEAQAIKSSQSLRWKNLLSFHCRNRLLLTGTPIQNNMDELWALLHFIMPDYFNSIDDFNAWFNKESKDGNMNGMNTDHLNRLHDILKPFMLRRIKKNVQSELGDKIEIDLMCSLTQRQTKLYNSLRSKMSSSYDELERAAIGATSDNSNTTQSSSAGDSKLINAIMEFRKVCNHPYLFERADVNSPFLFGSFGNMNSLLGEKDDLEVKYSSKNSINFDVPKLIYDEMVVPNFENNHLDIKEHLLNNKFNILQPTKENMNQLMVLSTLCGVQNINDLTRFSKTQLIKKAIKGMQNPFELKARLETVFNSTEYPSFKSNYVIPKKIDSLNATQSSTTDNVLSSLMNVRENFHNDHYINNLKPAYGVVAAAPPIVPNVFGRNLPSTTTDSVLFDTTITQAFSEIPAKIQNDLIVNKKIEIEELPKTEMWPTPLNKNFSTRHISMPSMDRFITDSAKLKKLDELLVKLKEEDHRVLVYFQMTKMMDLMEDYLTYRQYKHIRLDGSSKLEDRRDLVHDWQTKPEIFIFLLSTRAGGLGINLTAADTVIFYDSDWNPTIDSQAMDRAHRLGQKKQVTVYRLLCRDTIEERMRDTAIKKEQVQKVVMEGKKKQKQQLQIEPNTDSAKTQSP